MQYSKLTRNNFQGWIWHLVSIFGTSCSSLLLLSWLVPLSCLWFKPQILKLTTLSFASVFCMLLDSIMYFVCCWIALSTQYSLGKQAIKLYPIFSWFYFKVKISAHFWVGSKRICPTFVCLQPLVSLTF